MSFRRVVVFRSDRQSFIDCHRALFSAGIPQDKFIVTWDPEDLTHEIIAGRVQVLVIDECGDVKRAGFIASRMRGRNPKLKVLFFPTSGLSVRPNSCLLTIEIGRPEAPYEKLVATVKDAIKVAEREEARKSTAA